MNLASPARRASPARAEMVKDAESAIAEPALPHLAANVERAGPVEPAETVDDPRKYAPVPKKSTKQVPPTSVEALRGTSGADFEGRAAVLRGVAEKNCIQKVFPCFLVERDFVSYGEVERFVLIKGDSCFVYTEQTDVAPLYAIPISDLNPIIEDPRDPDLHSITISPSSGNMAKADLVTVLLKYQNGRIAYQFTFNTRSEKSIAQQFVSTIQKYGGEKKHMQGDKTSSVVYAEKVAKVKAVSQPEDPNKT